ncbi:hypothetical protein BW716_22840 [[Flexibacter] sp. ATCC 35208]|nr:hypothetical protein BW716_22840 [[Flexibacter] sp. ATCC 35208]
MLSNDTRRKLEHIVRGLSLEGEADHCTATRNYLCASFSTSRTVKKDFERNAIIKKEQAPNLTFLKNKDFYLPGDETFSGQSF